MEHELIDGTLHSEDRGIIGRCKCGWSTGYRFSSFAASAAFQDHREGAPPGPNGERRVWATFHDAHEG